MTFFKDLYDKTDLDFPDASGLGVPQKAALAQRMRSVGCKVVEIAEHLGLKPTRVYQLLKYEIDQDITELENQTFLDSLMIQIRQIEDEIDKCRTIQERILESTDPNTGTTRRPNREYMELGRLIKDYIKMLIDLKRVGGIIQTIDADMSLDNKLSDLRPETAETSVNEKNSEELKELLLAKLSGTSGSIRPKSLADIKDDRIL